MVGDEVPGIRPSCLKRQEDPNRQPAGELKKVQGARESEGVARERGVEAVVVDEDEEAVAEAEAETDDPEEIESEPAATAAITTGFGVWTLYVITGFFRSCTGAVGASILL